MATECKTMKEIYQHFLVKDTGGISSWPMFLGVQERQEITHHRKSMNIWGGFKHSASDPWVP